MIWAGSRLSTSITMHQANKPTASIWVERCMTLYDCMAVRRYTRHRLASRESQVPSRHNHIVSRQCWLVLRFSPLAGKLCMHNIQSLYEMWSCANSLVLDHKHNPSEYLPTHYTAILVCAVVLCECVHQLLLLYACIETRLSCMVRACIY
jgi:hypothetical protein